MEIQLQMPNFPKFGNPFTKSLLSFGFKKHNCLDFATQDQMFSERMSPSVLSVGHKHTRTLSAQY